MAATARRTRTSRELARLLAGSDLLPGVTPEAFSAIAGDLSTVRLRAGENVFAQGEAAR